MTKTGTAGRARVPVIAIDPGHGGLDSGALSFHGQREADFNLSLARHLADAAEASGTFEPALLRTTDTNMNLQERAAAANLVRPAAVLSLHCNSCPTETARGFEVWTLPGLTAADALATSIYNALFLGLPYPGRSDTDDGDPDREASFYMLRHTVAPAVLIEFGFLSNPFDCAYLAGDKNRRFVATLVERAVSTWLRGET